MVLLVLAFLLFGFCMVLVFVEFACSLVVLLVSAVVRLLRVGVPRWHVLFQLTVLVLFGFFGLGASLPPSTSLVDGIIFIRAYNSRRKKTTEALLVELPGPNDDSLSSQKAR